MNTDLVFLESERLILRPLLAEDFTPEYLHWLNDPMVNEYSQRRPFPLGPESMTRYNDYYTEHPEKGFVLAIIAKKEGRHIGNIALVNIQLVNRCAEIAILIGDRTCWGKSYGGECIDLLTRHAFTALNLHKIFAGTFNPAFVACVKKLGWKKEGEFRQRIWANNRYYNQIWMSILKNELYDNVVPEETKE